MRDRCGVLRISRQLIGGLSMGQNEIVRSSEFGLSHAAADLAGKHCAVGTGDEGSAFDDPRIG